MALFKSQIITQASGSVGGMTYSRNKGGMYIRARAIPTNPNTALQQAVRNAVTQLSNFWVDTLTAAQRTSWELYADNVPVINRLGDSVLIPALSHYVRSNTPRLQNGLPRVDTAPSTFDLGPFTDPTFAVEPLTDLISVTFDNTDDWANEDDSAMIIYASAPQNPTINYWKGPYRLAGKIDGDSVTPPTSPQTMDMPIGIEAGQKAFFKASVSRADGRLSVVFRGSAVAA